ncbi:dihydropteroate synthase [Streptococcus sp. zg-JUN1979]|uniref:dihydropteroate synthase n=1 Tax=Streptococcus sp. zg-JUN1979 TaxID=3391450 RepID=UPI0039A5389E
MKIGPYCIDRKCAIMGILNVTPDSFSDGGRYADVSEALKQVRQMIADGADIIDVGGESTRPRADVVSEEEELARVIPVIRALSEAFPETLISIDTYKTPVAKAALEAGAHIINDVWAGLYDGEMLSLAASYQVPIILMHNQHQEGYEQITSEVVAFLQERAQKALEAGLKKEYICLDPGFGFAKNEEDNIALLKGLDEVCALGYPVLCGISRKRVVNYLLGGNRSMLERDQGTAALSAWALLKGCQLVRVHHVKATKDTLLTLEQLVD